MNNFVQNPNLPQRAKIVTLGEKYADILDKPLKKLGVMPIYIPDNPCVDHRLSGHADISLFHAGGDRLYSAPYLCNTPFAEKLRELGFNIEFAEINQGEKYPHDSQLNIAAFGGQFIYGRKTAYQPAVEYLTNVCNARGIPINQGYAKCSILPVDGRAVITQDSVAACRCSEAGIEVLEISSGFVNLPGFDYGFLGGSAFKLSADTLVFTGTLDAHPDRAAISDFLYSRGIKAVQLTNEPVFDVGSIIPLTEY